MRNKIAGGYDPITKQNADAEYHYDGDERLVAIKSSTGVELTISEDPNKWTLSIKVADLPTKVQSVIKKALSDHMCSKGADRTTIDVALLDASTTLFCKGHVDSIIWEDKNKEGDSDDRKPAK